MTPSDFAQSMTRLGAAFRKDLSQATFEVYLEALGSLDAADFAEAVRWAVKHKTFLPTPAELLERAKHERTSRLRALPPAQHEAIPEWVTEPGEADVPALIADLLPKLTLADQRVKAMKPDRHDDGRPPVDMAARAAKANAALKAFRDYNAQQGVTW